MISFNTQLISQVNFHLPHLETEREAAHFSTTPRLELLDGDAMPIPVKLDILAITSTAKIIDYETETERYNKADKRASLPQFATMMADDSTLLSGSRAGRCSATVSGTHGAATQILVQTSRSANA